MQKLLKKMRDDHPEIAFRQSDKFCWSPKKSEVLYDTSDQNSPTSSWSLLHEVGHALLDHKTYNSDIELIEMEAAAWQKAQELGRNYGHKVDEDHIQDCLDTYRDWLHQRSACPRCNNRSLQQDNRHYKCFNCGQIWVVSASRFCRPYRLTKQTKTSPQKRKATFA